MYDILHLPNVIEIGKVGENEFRPIPFDLSPWVKILPNGVPSIVHIRPDETADDSYICASEFNDGILIWTPTAADLGTVEGYGKLEIWFEEAGDTTKRGKSASCQTHVRASIGPAEADPPAVQQAWLEQMTELKTLTVTAKEDAEDAAEDAAGSADAAEESADAAEAAQSAIENMSVSSETLEPGSSATVTKTVDPETGAVSLAFGIPKGAKGDKGDKGDKGNTGEKGDTGYPTDQQIQSSVNTWLDGHPEATTTVQDGAISYAKLNSSLKETVDDVSELKNQINVLQPAATNSDIGKALLVKTVENGVPTSYEYGEAGGGGTSDYTELTNKPKINNVELSGNKSLNDLGIPSQQDLSDDVSAWLEENIVEDPTVVIDSSLSVSGAAADAAATGAFKNAVMYKKITEYSPNPTKHSSTVLNTDGTISAGTATSQNVLEANVSGADKFTLHCSAYGGNSGTRYAFYTADSYSGCGTSTLIDSVKTYTRDSQHDYDVPSNAKILLVYMNSLTYFSCAKSEDLIKGYSSIAEEYDPDETYNIGDCRNHDGAMYICCAEINTPEAWNSAHWISSTVFKQLEKLHAAKDDFSERVKYEIGTLNAETGLPVTNQKYWLYTSNLIHITEETKVLVADGYEAEAYYYQLDDTYTGVHNALSGSTAETYFTNIVPAGSYIRFIIRIANSTTTLYPMDIPKFLDKLTFKTDYTKNVETIYENKDNATNGMAARMFAKGASTKTFSRAPAIIIAGQSNIAGVIPTSSNPIPSSITFPMQNIKYSPPNTPTTFDDGIIANGRFSTYWGIDLPLYSALNGLGSTVYAIKYASTGTGIDFATSNVYKWTPFYEKLSSLNYSMLYSLETKIRTLGASNPNAYDLRALVWHQGEQDSPNGCTNGNPYARERYYENFKNVIAYIRGVAGNERLPVVYGTISHNSASYDPIIEAAQWKIAEEDPNTFCIDMSGAGLIDQFHFNPDAAVYFGYKAFDALIDFGVITGTKINPVCPWQA